MGAYAELEISLHHREEEARKYTVEFRYSQPNSEADARLGLDQPALVRLDLTKLRSLSFDSQAYSQLLTESFFTDPTVRGLFAQARASAHSLKVPLRVRLLVGPSAPELHTVSWERLRDPEDGSPLFTGEYLFFSRYLSSLDMRPVQLRLKGALRALVAAADPVNLSDYQDLAPIDVEAELRRAREGLGKISVTQLGRGGRRRLASLDNLIAALRAEKPDILYLVCHGALVDEEPILWLEAEDGRAAVISGEELVTRFKELSRPPLLVVLASCQSAGRESASEARAALGPRLSQAGIPAVVAVQGDISQKTVAEFMSVFFQALQQDGQIDRAMALGRGRVRERPDYWMPVLYTRLKSGCLFLDGSRWRRVVSDWRFWVTLVPLVLALLGGGWYFISQPKPMGPGFNVAVAEFSVQDESGRLRSTPQGMAVSQSFFDTIDRSLQELPDSIQYDRLGPQEVGIVRGQDAAEREAEAGRIAERINAGVLIYGVITSGKDGYQVEPGFFVSDREFRYGNEVTGPNRLGQPVPVDLTQAPENLVGTNEKLNGRFQALQNLVKGLANFYVGNYLEATADFQTAADLPGWQDEEGKEVVYILLGSALLRGRDANSRDLSSAEAAQSAFQRASQINPAYARAYLGLGSATLALASRFNPNQEQLLIEARDWLLTALEKPDQPPSAYVPVKVAYELGNVTLLGVEQSIAGFSKEDARRYYNEVLKSYTSSGRPGELIWYAGHTHLSLGYLAGTDHDWPGMLGECRLAIQELNQLNRRYRPIALSLARAYVCVGSAEAHRKHTDLAGDAYRQAIQVGGAYVEPTELAHWQNQLNSLQQGTP